MLTVENYNQMMALKNHKKGETCYVKETNKIYRYSGLKWDEFETPVGNLNVSLYDLNKQLMSQMKDLDDEALAKVEQDVNDFCAEGTYFMLLGNDKGYYTMLKRSDEAKAEDTFGHVVMECCQNIGTIRSAEKVKDGSSIEIWIADKKNDASVYYLFNYDGGVELCR